VIVYIARQRLVGLARTVVSAYRWSADVCIELCNSFRCRFL